MDHNQTGPRKTKEIAICRKNDGKILTVKDEVVALHYWTDRLLFAVSEIPPGGRSTLDPGHRGADEVAYVIKGKIVVEFPDLDRNERLNAGDSILIPEGVSHTVINFGDEEAVSVWVTAPHLGYEMSELTGTDSESRKE
jgi:mannose-6-phosphate isomerase-like protein (cupin superfamily)